MGPALTLEPWEALLILRLRQLRKSGAKAVMVHLDADPGVRSVGNREPLIDKETIKPYSKDNN